MLSSEISTLLTGRIIEFVVYPFTYSEAIDYCSDNSIMVPELNTFIKFGGYPLRLNMKSDEDSLLYLEQLLRDILEKDIFSRDSSIERQTFRRIFNYVLLNSGNDFNAENILNYLQTNYKNKNICSLKTIYNYLEKMEKAYLIMPINRYNIPGKEILKSNPKYYAIDNGMKLIASNTIKYDKGKCLENAVLIELLSRGYRVYVGKTYKGEVDFVVVKNGRKCFIQVCTSLLNEDIIKREFGAFSCIKDPSPKYVFSIDEDDMSQNGITHINIQKFMLKKVDLFLS